MANILLTTLSDAALRNAIANANSGDTITFDSSLAGGIITLTQGELVIDKSLTIDGENQNISIDAGRSSRVINVNDSSNTKIDVVLNALTIREGNATGDGGGIWNQENLTITNSFIIDNTATDDGGGIFNNGTLNLTDTHVTQNQATIGFADGGGIYNNGTLTVTESVISGNAANDNAGGIYTNDVGNTTITGSLIQDNTANNDGGGLFNFGAVTINDSTISNNLGTTAAADGGGVAVFGETTITNSTISGNSAGDDGGGIYVKDRVGSRVPSVTITSSIIEENTATSDGGGVFNFGDATITDSTISRNTAPDGQGSGVASFGSSFTTSTTVTSSFIAGNTNSDVDFITRSTNTFNSGGDNRIGKGNAISVFNQTGDETNIMPLEFRSMSGYHNNLTYTNWGTPEYHLLRMGEAAYEDDISEPRGGSTSNLPNPRAISQTVFDQNSSIPNSLGASDWLWQWGQFIDHDLSLTPATSGESFNVLVPTGDALFDPFNTGTQEIGLTRSIYDTLTGTSASNPREQINEITAYIDGSNVYGSNDGRAEALRTNDGTGKLKISIGDNGEILLPFNTEGLENDDPFGRPASQLFLAGDIRANEQTGLTAAHTLFVRQHNRLAEDIDQRLDNGEAALVDLFLESGLSEGDFIYEAARRVVGAEIQAITYNEFVPTLLGNNALPGYIDYDPDVNPGISNEFSTAAFRVGHTMLSSEIQRINPDGTSNSSLTLRSSFFNPDLVTTDGIDSVLLGLASQEAQEIDTKLIDDVRNFLFGMPGSGGMDLASLNIQRGREHGLPSYNDTREALGFDPITNFSEISSDLSVQTALQSAYGNVDDIDLWVGGLAEDHLSGALVGETFHEILTDQFVRLRDGDRFYFENDPTLQVLAPNVGNTTLADVITANSDITTIQNNVFLV
ncbi:MAG: peroxidase family protein [Microcoleaceae cyanobacterium]